MTGIIVCGFMIALGALGYLWLRIYRKGKYLKDVAKVVVVTGVSGLILCVAEIRDNRLTEDARLRRSQAGGSTLREELELNVDGLLQDYDYTVEVESRRLCGEALEQLFAGAQQEAETKFLGSNVSFDEIRQEVVLPGKLQDGQIRASWSFEPAGVIDESGGLHVEELDEKGQVVTVSLTLKYFEQSRNYTFGCHVYRRKIGPAEQLLNDIGDYLEVEQKQTGDQEYFRLPTQLGGYVLRWSKKPAHSYKIILLLGMIAVVVVYAQQDVQERRQQQRRRERLLLQYPDMVSKLSLLLGAGMTLSGAWERIVLTYENQVNHNRAAQEDVYEEMLVSYRELQDGIGELKVYERFGERCGMPQYRKLSTLLVQNLRKGSAGLNRLLEQEVEEAFALRKNHAKRAGEEAGTKMLLPMMLMLCVVMVIILVPAFLAFEL